MCFVYITDANYVMPTVVSITSLICNCSSEDSIRIYVIICGLNDKDVRKIEALRTGSIDLILIEGDEYRYSELAKSCKSKGIHVTAVSLYKMDIANLLMDESVALYIDGDTIINSSVSELFDVDLTGKYLAAVEDMGDRKDENGYSVLASRLGLKRDRYFNSGVMLMNLELMRRDSIPDRLFKYRETGINYFMDQDTFNYVLGDQTLWLGYEYNFRAPILAENDFGEVNNRFFRGSFYDPDECLEHQRIIHLTDKYKPWIYYSRWFSDLFLKYYNNSPYKEEPLAFKTYLDIINEDCAKYNGLYDRFWANASKCGIYAFWDLIEQRAYMPKSEQLFKRGLAHFRENQNGKRVWLFGCNDASDMFAILYGNRLKIAGFLDNSPERQGTLFAGLEVFKPEEIVKKMSAQNDVIIICLRLNADSVAQQLDKLHFFEYYSLGVLLAGIPPYQEFLMKIEGES